MIGRLRPWLPGVAQLLGVAVAWYALDALTAGVHPALAPAVSHARDIVSVERPVGLLRLDALLGGIPFGHVATGLYVGVHFLGTFVAAVLLWRRAPGVWRSERWALLLLVSVASLVFAVYPVAPPWALGFHDATPWARPAASYAGLDLLAAFPSLHVGVAAWLAGAWRRAGLSRWVWLYPAAMTVFVVATGNHYVLDCAAGWVLAVASGRLLRSAAMVRRRAAVVGGGVFAWLQTPRLSPLSVRRQVTSSQR